MFAALALRALRWRSQFATFTIAHWFAVSFTVMLLAAAAPIFATTLPPLSDYANHLARMHVLAWHTIIPELDQLYLVHWSVIPNLLMDAVVPPLVPLLGVVHSGQVFLVVTLLSLATGPLAIHRALYGRISPMPLAAFLFLYNGILLYGLMNYLLGLGIALWGVAGWIMMRDRSIWLRLGAATAIVLVLFFCHLFAVGLFGLGLLALELWRCRIGGGLTWRRLLPVMGQLAIPFLPVIPLMAASPTLGLSADILWESRGKMDGIYAIFQLYGDVPDMLFAAAVIGGATWLARRGELVLHPGGWVILAIGTLVFMAMPRVLFGSWIADQRLPIALLFLVLGFVRPLAGDQTRRSAFLVAIIGMTLLRLIDVQMHWSRIDDASESLRRSAAQIDIGASVLVAHADVPSGGEGFRDAVSHVPCVAVFDRDALVSTIFSVTGKQILGIRQPFRQRVDAEDGDPPTVSQMLAATDGPVQDNPHYWDNWPDKYGYVYVLYTQPGDANPNPDHLELIDEGRWFQLYRISHEDQQPKGDK